MSSSPFMIPLTNNAGTNGAGGSATPTSTMSTGNFNFGNSANPNAPQPSNINPFGLPATSAAMPAAQVNSTFSAPGGPAPALNPASSPTSTMTTGNPVTNQWNPQGNAGLFGSTEGTENNIDQSISATFGSGIGNLLSQYLQSEGGFNSALTTQTVDAQTAAMQQQIQQGLGNLQTNLAESGISPNSSVSALEQSNYMSQATTQENAITAEDFFNMWSQSSQQENSLVDLIGGAGAAKKTGQSNFLTSILGDVIGAAGTASEGNLGG
jgi:hypothetical protein